MEYWHGAYSPGFGHGNGRTELPWLDGCLRGLPGRRPERAVSRHPNCARSAVTFEMQESTPLGAFCGLLCLIPAQDQFVCNPVRVQRMRVHDRLSAFNLLSKAWADS